MVYAYDLGNRVTYIAHQQSICFAYPCTWYFLLTMQQTYNGRNPPTWVTERGSNMVYYCYNDFGRLRRDVRQGSNAYDIRQRFMDRPLTPWSFQNNNVADTGGTVETRYDGSSAFLDFEMGSAMRAFEPGIGRIRDLHDDPKGDY